MPHFRGEAAPLHPKFPAGSAAAVVEEGVPSPIDAPPIVYTNEDDKAIEQYVRGIGKFFARISFFFDLTANLSQSQLAGTPYVVLSRLWKCHLISLSVHSSAHVP